MKHKMNGRQLSTVLRLDWELRRRNVRSAQRIRTLGQNRSFLDQVGCTTNWAEHPILELVKGAIKFIVKEAGYVRACEATRALEIPTLWLPCNIPTWNEH